MWLNAPQPSTSTETTVSAAFSIELNTVVVVSGTRVQSMTAVQSSNPAGMSPSCEQANSQ